MKRDKIGLKTLLEELKEITSDWMDDTARDLILNIQSSIDYLRQLKRIPTRRDFEIAFVRDPAFLDICRLFYGKGQEPMAHIISDEIGKESMNWVNLRKLALKEPQFMAEIMMSLQLDKIIDGHLNRKWSVEDILIERYKMSRGRAISGQKRGRALENAVENILKRNNIPFDRGVTFVGLKEKSAKCDFAIPNKNHPKIILEAKSFEATGSKMTDFLGDVLKIGQAKEYHTYFFLVTDGRGWYNRQSDLKKIVEYHNEGLIDMIYTQARLKQLAADVKYIFENE